MKGNAKIKNKSAKNYNDIVKRCSKAWKSFCDEEENIKKLCSRAWAS
jgi:hypothetical protein